MEVWTTRYAVVQIVSVVIPLPPLPTCFCGSSYSLIRTIVRQRASTTEGTAEEASTVGIELHRHRLDETSIEFYDCAGQLDYAGMHQTFLSRRALYLVVWDIQAFEGCTGDDLDKVGSLKAARRATERKRSVHTLEEFPMMREIPTSRGPAQRIYIVITCQQA